MTRGHPRSDPGAGLDRLTYGFDLVADLVASTLGPGPGSVLTSTAGRTEFIADSSTLARRAGDLADPAARPGAAIAQQLVTSMTAHHGTGGATAAVLAQAIVRHARRQVAAGESPVAVRRGIDLAAAEARGALQRQARPVTTNRDFAALAAARTADSALAAALADIAETVGSFGDIVIESAADRLDHSYPSGQQWLARPADSQLLPGATAEVTVRRPAIALVDGELTTADQVVPYLELATALPDRRPLVIIATDITGVALSTIAMNVLRRPLTVVPISLTSPRLHHGDDFADLALLTGGEVRVQAGKHWAGEVLLGQARRVTIERQRLTIGGGTGDPHTVQQRIKDLQTYAAELDPGSVAWSRVWRRQARLAGTIAILHLGTAGRLDASVDKSAATRAVQALRAAQQSGMVDGAGLAYLRCRPAIDQLIASLEDPGERAGARSLRVALQAPLERIVRNYSRTDAAAVIDQVRAAGYTRTYDACTGQLTARSQDNIQDVQLIVADALDRAAATAGLLLTAHVCILGRSS